MKKRIKIFVMAWILLGICFGMQGFYPMETEAATFSVEDAKEAKAVILLERDTGEILHEQNSHQRLPPASLTKVMTLLLVMEAIDQGNLALDDLVTVSEHAASMGGSQVFLAAGEKMSVEDLIKAVAIASANDASVALAEKIAGSEEAFVSLMNQMSEKLDLENTKFQNASGLPAKDHYSSAHDLAVIAKALLKYEKITAYTSIYEDYLRKGEANEFWLVNTNRLVRFFPYVDGLKTGYTKEAKFGLVASAEKDGMRVISVVMGAASSKDRNALTMNLIHHAFEQYETERIYDRNEVISQYTNIRSKNYHYPIKTSEPVSILRKKGSEAAPYESKVELFHSEDLPIHPGEVIGKLVVQTDGTILMESPLYAEDKIEHASIFTLMKRSMKMFTKYE